jgi:ubiquinone/menaquinone biosynthesis C-methylase UbiE
VHYCQTRKNIARDYKLISYATVIDPLLNDMRKYLPRFAGMKAGDTVLDVCCGSGAQICEYLRCGVLAQGVDNNPRMLALARRYNLPQNGATSSLMLADAAQLPFADEEFDFTSVSLALHDKESPVVDMILSEMKRVTRDGGGLVFADYSVPLPDNVTGVVIRTIERFAGREHSRCFGNYLKIGGLHSILRRNGITAIKETMVKQNTIMLVLAEAA